MMGRSRGNSNMATISNEMVTAYWFCPRKAHLLNTAEPLPSHSYAAHLDQMNQRSRHEHMAKFREQHPDVSPGVRFDSTMGIAVFVDVVLQNGDLQALCDFLTRLPD